MNEQSRQGPSLLQSMWRYRAVVIGCTLLAAALGYLIASQQAPSFVAEARLFLSNPTTTPGLQQSGSQINLGEYVPQQAARASSRGVLEAAREGLDPAPSLEDLADTVTIEPNAQDLALVVSAAAPSGEAAADRANAVATAYMSSNQAAQEQAAQAAVAEIDLTLTELEAQLQQLDSQLAQDPQNFALQSQIQNLSTRLIELESAVAQVRIDAGLRGDGVDLFEAAAPPQSPARPQPELTALSLALLAAILSSMWAYWYAARSQRVLSRRDPEAILGAPLLGEVPLYRVAEDDSIDGLLHIDPAAAEAYEFVLSSIEFALGDLGGKSLLVTSTLPGDGKTTTALQLGIAASRDRRRVVLVDADIRARGLTTVLGAEDRTGLSDLAAQELQPSDVMRRYRFSDQSQIPVVTAGTRRGDPAALLRTQAFRRAMGGISDAAELVIIDCAPLLAVADATIVAGAADGVVIVVSSGTPVSELQKVRERMKFVPAPLLGYIFNRSEAETAAAYGYGYGMAEDRDGTRRMLPGTSLRGRGERNGQPGRRRLPSGSGAGTSSGTSGPL